MAPSIVSDPLDRLLMVHLYSQNLLRGLIPTSHALFPVGDVCGTPEVTRQPRRLGVLYVEGFLVSFMLLHILFRWVIDQSYRTFAIFHSVMNSGFIV